MSDELLFNRVVKINVADNLLEGYDCEFEVVRTLEPEPNIAKIKVYNLSSDLQAAVQKAEARVSVTVGYPRTSGQIFIGDVRYAPSAVVGSDWVTIIEAGDGEKDYKDTQVALTWSKGKPVKKVIEEILDSFEDLLPGDFAKTAKLAIKEQLPRGGALSGNAVRVLDELVRGYGFRFSIQDGQFQFVDATGQNQKTAVLLTPDTGLVNEPELGEKDKKTGKAKGKVKALMQPSVIPGSVIDVQGTSTIKGQFIVQKVTHEGNNGFGTPFYSNMEILTK